MSRRQSSPAPPSSATVPRDVERIVRDFGPEHFRKGALGVGPLKDGERAGQHNNTVYAFVALNGAGTYDVPHKLGQVPVRCELVTVQYPKGTTPVPHAKAAAVDPEDWTKTACRMDVIAIAGSLDGVTAVFEVKGG